MIPKEHDRCRQTAKTNMRHKSTQLYDDHTTVCIPIQIASAHTCTKCYCLGRPHMDCGMCMLWYCKGEKQQKVQDTSLKQPRDISYTAQVATAALNCIWLHVQVRPKIPSGAIVKQPTGGPDVKMPLQATIWCKAIRWVTYTLLKTHIHTQNEYMYLLWR